MYLPTLTLEEARAKYFALNGLPSDGGEQSRWAFAKVGPFTLAAFPNFSARLRTLPRHDLHHIANDCDTSLVGEGLVAAWELGSGCSKYWVAWWLSTQAVWWGILLAPARTFEFFRIGENSENLYRNDWSDLPPVSDVGDLREALLPDFDPEFSVAALLRFVAYALLGVVSIAVSTPLFFLFALIGLLLPGRK